MAQGRVGGGGCAGGAEPYQPHRGRHQRSHQKQRCGQGMERNNVFPMCVRVFECMFVFVLYVLSFAFLPPTFIVVRPIVVYVKSYHIGVKVRGISLLISGERPVAFLLFLTRVLNDCIFPGFECGGQ